MQSQQQNKKYLSCRTRLLLFIAFFSFIILAGIIFVLGSSGILPLGDAWSKTLGTLFVVLGVLFGLGQWLMPLTPFQLTGYNSNSTTTSTTNIDKLFDVFPSHSMMKLPKYHGMIKKLEDNNDIKYRDNGAVIMYTHKDVFRAPITLRAVNYNYKNTWDFRPEMATAYVERQIIRFRPIYFAVFPCIPEGNYTIDHVPLSFPLLGQNVTVYRHQIVEIDGRIGN